MSDLSENTPKSVDGQDAMYLNKRVQSLLHMTVLFSFLPIR